MFITYPKQNLTKNFALLVLLGALLLSCQSTENKAKERYPLELPSGEVISVELAKTPEERTEGLSGRPPESLGDDQGMLFVYQHSDVRQFWMPETHFDLTIAFLDKNFKILAVERDVPKHPTRKEPVPKTGSHWARHVLEVKNSSPLAKKLKKGMVLKWQDPERPWEKAQETHRRQ